jgi:hypothetical protein
MAVGLNSVDRRKFVPAVEGSVAVELEVAAVGLEIAGLGVSLLVFSFFFVVVEMVDFPLDIEI